MIFSFEQHYFNENMSSVGPAYAAVAYNEDIAGKETSKNEEELFDTNELLNEYC